MELTFKGLNRKGTQAFYSGLRTTIAIKLANFPDGVAPPSLSIDGPLVAAATPKRKLTKEERAALPKPTLAEKIAKREAQLAKMREKLNQEQTASML